MPFSIVNDDISRVAADIVVNAANEALAPGGGVCGAIFRAAGHDEMLAACRRRGGCPTGGAVATEAFGLPARWCVHAVGPVWRGGSHGEEEALRSCYRSVFRLVDDLGARSVALPLISSGIFGYPFDRALAVAREEVVAYLGDRDGIEIELVLFDRDRVRTDLGLARDVAPLLGGGRRPRRGRVGARGPVGEGSAAGRAVLSEERIADYDMLAAPCAPATVGEVADGTDGGLADALDHLDPTFSETLLALIDESGMTDAEAYRRANVSRQLFSKIRSDRAYRPSKPTAAAFAIALGLDEASARALIGSAGFALTRSSAFDVIVLFFIEHEIFDVFRLNEVLFAYGQPLVGSV